MNTSLPLFLAFLATQLAAKPSASLKNPLPAKAYRIPKETVSEESGYFSIIEGKNGKLYLGTAKYGSNAYLVEFDPGKEQMRIAGTLAHDDPGTSSGSCSSSEHAPCVPSTKPEALRAKRNAAFAHLF